MSDFLEKMSEYATHYATQDRVREELIQASRPINKLAKQSIYALHRDDFPSAKEKQEEALQALQKCFSITEQALEQGALRAAVEELTESIAFRYVLEHKKLPTKEALAIPQLSAEIFMQALSDVSGELIRYAVKKAAKKEFPEVLFAKQLCEEMQEGFLLFDFRGGELRKKSDMLRHNLSKLETIHYEVSLRE